MILVDTSVWVDHLRSGNNRLAALLQRGVVLSHPFVVGEIACGHLRDGSGVIDLLRALPSGIQASDDEVLALVENRRLYGVGVGWIDVHLIASALLSDAPLWTFDKRLSEAANRAGARV